MQRLRLAGAMLALALCVVAPVRANDIQYFSTIYNTDWAYAGAGDYRDNGNGLITVSGVSGAVTHSYLYWQGPTNTTDPLANASVLVNGVPVTGTNIGFSSDNCWGYLNSQAYRADITSLVTGNGVYAVTGLGGGSVNTNGASIVTFFNDGNSANNRDVVIFDGNDSNINNPYDADGWNVTLSGINYSGGMAQMVLGVGDGQLFLDDAIVVNGTTIAPIGQIFPGALHGGFGPDHNGSLWDINSFDVTSLLSPGMNTITLTTGVYSDCLSLVHAMVDLPAGAAPPTDVPEPGAILTGMVFLGGLGMTALRARRKA